MAFDSMLHIPLRFYDDLDKQDRFKPYVTKAWYQYTDATHLPEFQLKVASAVTSCTVKLVDIQTGTETTITQGSDFYLQAFTSYKYFIYDRTASLSTIPEGGYYLKITAGSETFYSEIFWVTDIIGKTTLVYYNTNDIGGIDYSNGTNPQFKITFIFDGSIAKPEYVIEEEGVEDGDGNVLILFQRRVKKYKMWFYAPEYIADAMSLVPLHDNVTLTTYYGETAGNTGQIYDFNITVDWLDSKGLAKITCDFRDQPVIKTNCANNIV
jgi:hypothetical protein